MLPNTMSRNVCHSVSFCCAEDLIHARACCVGNLSRLAISEMVFLQKLACAFASIVGIMLLWMMPTTLVDLEFLSAG